MSNPRIEVIQGDITQLQVDAIVNAANSSLMGGGGVDGAIHQVGGPTILSECMNIRKTMPRGLATGEAVITTGGKLAAKHVIHTVGPVWTGGRANEDVLLANAYRNSLRLAVENGARTVAFPNISTGVYRFPKEQAAKIAVREVQAFLETDRRLEKVVFCCFDPDNRELYQRLLADTGGVGAEPSDRDNAEELK
jgi:O-acetyl-ADP-ribose deacetylase